MLLANQKDVFPILNATDSIFNNLLNSRDMSVGEIPVEIFEQYESWLIKAYIPGLTKKDIHIKVKSDNIIYVSAVRPRPENLYLTELEYGEISASVKLGSFSLVKKEDVKAEYKDGVIYITVSKQPDSMPYTIDIE